MHEFTICVLSSGILTYAVALAHFAAPAAEVSGGDSGVCVCTYICMYVCMYVSPQVALHGGMQVDVPGRRQGGSRRLEQILF